jgi:hypothetical protein
MRSSHFGSHQLAEAALIRRSAPDQRAASATRDCRHMTTPTNSAHRVDRILSLIDECLAEVDSSLRLVAGDGLAAVPVRAISPSARRHLTAVRS